MTVAYVLPAEAVASAISAVLVVAVYALVHIARLRERIAKVEEWIRQEERKNGLRR